jgi:hypothetical protein
LLYTRVDSSHSFTSSSSQRRCRSLSRRWCGPGAAMPRSRLAAQSCSVETGTPVIARTSWAVSITEPSRTAVIVPNSIFRRWHWSASHTEIMRHGPRSPLPAVRHLIANKSSRAIRVRAAVRSRLNARVQQAMTGLARRFGIGVVWKLTPRRVSRSLQPPAASRLTTCATLLGRPWRAPQSRSGMSGVAVVSCLLGCLRAGLVGMSSPR